jgi:hypothetical protein
MNDKENSDFQAFAASYFERLLEATGQLPLETVKKLADTLLSCWKDGRQVFIFGNGGSAGNAMHLANDLIYGISKTFGSGLRITALPANGSVTTCLANDEGYESIFSYQLAVLAQPATPKTSLRRLSIARLAASNHMLSSGIPEVNHGRSLITRSTWPLMICKYLKICR